MTSIFDRLAVRRPLAQFRPTTVRELFVLRLAQKLGEPAAAQHYAELARGHRTLNHGHSPRDLGRSFHVELASAREQNGHAHTERLLAIKVERRSIAVAVFVGSTLDFHDVRHLSSQPEKAESSAIGFLSWVISSFDIESSALERMTNGNEIRRAVLNHAILTMLRASAIPVWEISKRELLEAYGYPPLRSRVELRQATHTMLWSMFNTEKPNCQEIDAASLGLHVQTERLFLY